MEEFVVRVFKGGKVTVPKQVRELCGIEDGDYVRLALMEVMKRVGEGEWKKRRIE
jgi:AbrB family looped-hinge helix DNA binding protein